MNIPKTTLPLRGLPPALNEALTPFIRGTITCEKKKKTCVIATQNQVQLLKDDTICPCPRKSRTVHALNQLRSCRFSSDPSYLPARIHLPIQRQDNRTAAFSYLHLAPNSCAIYHFFSFGCSDIFSLHPAAFFVNFADVFLLPSKRVHGTCSLPRVCPFSALCFLLFSPSPAP